MIDNTIVLSKSPGTSILRRSKGESLKLVRLVLGGFAYPFAPPLCMGFVDVEDVCEAHCRAMIRTHLTGRFVLVAESSDNALFRLSEILRPRYGEVLWHKASACLDSHCSCLYGCCCVVCL